METLRSYYNLSGKFFQLWILDESILLSHSIKIAVTEETNMFEMLYHFNL